MPHMQSKQIKSFFFNLPNKLTLSRIAVIPVLCILFYFEFKFTRVLSALIFLLASLTDFFDGYLARKYNSETTVGKLLDPIADKVLVITGLVLLVSAGYLYPWLAILLICRDTIISGLRLIAVDQGFSIDVIYTGKLKTAFLLAAIVCLMIYDNIPNLPLAEIGMICAWIALAFSIHSAYKYWEVFYKNFKNAKTTES